MINLYSDLTQSPWITWLVTVGLIAGALTALIRFVPPAWKTLRRFTNTIDSLADLPEFITRTDATLAGQNVKIEEIHHEVNYNNGSSVKDAITRVEKGVKGLYDRADTTDAEAVLLRADLENTRPVVRKRTPKKETP